VCVCLCRFNPCTVNWKIVKSFHICPAWFACTISISLLVHGCIIAYFFGCWEKVIAFKIIANGFMVYVCLCMFQVALLCAGFLDPNGPNCHAQEEFGASWNGPWRDRVTKYRWSMLDVRPCRSTVDPPKQDAAHEPECSHVEHYCEIRYLNSLDFSPVTVPVHCRLWNAEEGGECKV